MEKIKIKQAIAVEGRYDVHTVSTCFETHIIALGGFGVIHNSELKKLLQDEAKTNGLIVLTDSDSAGFLIRSRVAEAVRPYEVLHAYIPDIPGKERRKKIAGAEGLLGVEGVSPEVIIRAVLGSGAQVIGENKPNPGWGFSRQMLFDDGLIGANDSSEKRKKLMSLLGLPSHLSVSALVKSIDRLVSPEQYRSALKKIDCDPTPFPEQP